MDSQTAIERKSTVQFAGWIGKATAGIALGIAGVIFLTTLLVVWNAYTPFPLFDYWDHWRLFLRDGNYSSFLFTPHNEHRIAVPRLFFMVDHFLFRARSEFVLVCILLLQTLTGVFLCRFVRRSVPGGQSTYWLAVGTIFCGVFSAQQFTNLTWNFQIQFVLVNCAAIGAIWATTKAAEAHERGLGPEGWLTAACILAMTATYSMANGLLVWPVLAIFAAWLRLPLRYALMFAIDTLLVGWFYMHGLPTPAGQLSPIYVLFHHFPAALIFSVEYLGAPATALTHLLPQSLFPSSDASLQWVAGVFGFCGMALALYLWLASILRRTVFDKGQAALIHVSLFILLTAASVGLGRATMTVSDPLTSRYKTPALIFWITILTQCWLRLDRPSGRNVLTWKIAQSAVALTALAALALEQPVWIKYSKLYSDVIGNAQAAVVADVFDEEQWKTIYHTPANMVESLAYLRQNKLSIFSEDWTSWVGQPVNNLFTLSSANFCLGSFDSATPIASATKSGWRVSGWAWDKQQASGPGIVVFVDHNGIVAGVAQQVYERPDVAAAFPDLEKGSRVGWTGYVAGSHAQTLTAYLFSGHGNSLCRFGQLTTQQIDVDSTVRPSQGAGSCEAERLVGFQKPEEWGAWSATDPARLLFRHAVKGHLKAKFTAYGLTDGPPNELHITIGDQTRIVLLPAKPTTFDLDYRLPEAAGEAVFSGISPRSAASLGIGADGRAVAVGLVKLDCILLTQ